MRTWELGEATRMGRGKVAGRPNMVGEKAMAERDGVHRIDEGLAAIKSY